MPPGNTLIFIFIYLFAYFLAMATQHAESLVPDQGLNPRPLCWKHSLHWTAREVLHPLVFSGEHESCPAAAEDGVGSGGWPWPGCVQGVWGPGGSPPHRSLVSSPCCPLCIWSLYPHKPLQNLLEQEGVKNFFLTWKVTSSPAKSVRFVRVCSLFPA